MASDNPGSSNVIAGALAYPVNDESSRNLQPVADQPRQPRTLQGLLRFAMEATKAEDAPGNSELGPMDEERRTFLQNALNAHTIRIDEVLQRNITVLTDPDIISKIGANDQLPAEVTTAFQELGEYIDDIDVANDFEKMGGFSMFPLCYATENTALHRWANLTLALVCQNNPRCQTRAMHAGLLSLLLHWLRDKGIPEDRTLRAISSMIRNFEPTTRAFVEEGGCDVLATALRSARHAELASAAFLVTHLCRTSAAARDKFIKNNMIQAVVETFRAGRSNATEYLLSILAALIEMQPGQVRPIYKDPALGLQQTLEDHLKVEDVSSGRFIEEKEHCEKILQLMAEDTVVNGVGDVEQDVEAADR